VTQILFEGQPAPMMSSILFLILLQGFSSLSGLVPIVLMIAVMWFLLIRPQQKRQQSVQQMIEMLKVGDKIITTGGIHGTITMVRDDKKTLQVKIADNPAVRIDISRSAVAGLQGTEEISK
jgi:preprotein translocase subunit YajC